MTKPISPSSHDHASGNQPRLRMYAGGTTGEMAKRFAEIERNVEEAEAKRAQRRKELHEKNIAADVRVVAWIDILGFSNQLQHARTEPEYRAVYHRMLRVQDAFDVPSASDEPDKREDINAAYGRTVLALSDGLVVAASPKAKMRESMTPYDLLMSLVGQIVMAQAHCAMRGIFLRGGISIGPFYYENNILLSPALIRAYKLETERAGYPVIIVTQEDIATLRALPGIECYAKALNPHWDIFFLSKRPVRRRENGFSISIISTFWQIQTTTFSTAKRIVRIPLIARSHLLSVNASSTCLTTRARQEPCGGTSMNFLKPIAQPNRNAPRQSTGG